MGRLKRLNSVLTLRCRGFLRQMSRRQGALRACLRDNLHIGEPVSATRGRLADGLALLRWRYGGPSGPR